MEVTTETVAPREVEFTIHPQPEEVEEARRKAARKVAQRVRIPGFRPGKAPYVLVERTVGKRLLTEEAAEILAPDLFKRVVEEGGYQPFDRPTLRITQEEPLELKIRVPLRPTVELPDYRSMRIEPAPEVQVTPEQEEKLLNDLREEQGIWVPVERPAQVGDQITVDSKGTSGGEALFERAHSEIVLTEQLSPQGFLEAVVGIAPGETREFTVTYPESHAEERLAGKTVDLTVTLREVKERRLPELSDEFARTIGDYGSLEELRARLREGLKAQMEADARGRMAAQALDQVVQQSRLEYPNQAVEQEIDRLVRERDRRLRQQGFTLDTYLRVVHKSMAQLRDELRPEAEESLRRDLVLLEVARAEGIQVQPEEVGAEVARIAQAYGEQADAARSMLMQEDVLGAVVADLRLRRALERLVSIVTGRLEAAPEAPEAEAPPEGDGEKTATG
ncbi:MAG: trigger factor, partial [Anaerolineae bacterium]|nr:trigger factor [Anaerolineae bacterium]